MNEWYIKLIEAFYTEKVLEGVIHYLNNNTLPDRMFLQHGQLINLDKIAGGKSE